MNFSLLSTSGKLFLIHQFKTNAPEEEKRWLNTVRRGMLKGKPMPSSGLPQADDIK